MSSTDIPTPPQASQNNSTAALFVSLYLVVLAFFIMLNTIATLDAQKEGKAVGSVQKAFSNTNIDIDQPGIEYEVPTGPQSLLEHYYGQVEQIVSLIDAQIYVDGDQLYTVIPVSQLFGVGSVNVLSRQNSFLDSLSLVLREVKDNTALDMEVLVGSNSYLQGGDNQLDILRAGAIAREMRNRYVRREQLSVGLMPTHPDFVILSFVPRDQTELRLDLPEGW